MNTLSLVRKAKRSIKHSRAMVRTLENEHSKVLDSLLSLICAMPERDCELFAEYQKKDHIEARLKHHRANIARLQSFATLDREQARGLLAWLESARAGVPA